MNIASRRQFLTDVGHGMLIAGLGVGIASELGVRSAFAEADDARLNFKGLEPLVRLMQDTQPDDLLPVLVEKLHDGANLEQLVAAAALANARTFGGEHYRGYHAFMALAPSFQMAMELPEAERPLPVLKVLYRNSEFLQSVGGSTHEILHVVEPAATSAGPDARELLHAANRNGNTDEAERIFATIAKGDLGTAYDAILLPVEDRGDVHTTVLAWRAWETLRFTGREFAHTLLRQTVRHCIAVDSGLEDANKVPQLLEEHRLVEMTPGTRRASDEWIDQMTTTILASTPVQAMEAVAAALADGIRFEEVGEAISLASNQLVLRQAEDWTGVMGRRTHGDSPGVHASDTVNAWRNISRVAMPRHAAAGMLLAAANVAQSYQWSRDPERGGQRKEPFPSLEHLIAVQSIGADALLADLEDAIRSNEQLHACAVAHRYCDHGHDASRLFETLRKYAISEDGRLHGEKYYCTVAEEFRTTRPAFRWRQLVALARVTASGYGYDLEDDRGQGEGHRAPGYERARGLLNV